MAFSFSRKWLDEILQDDELSAKEKAQRIMEGHIEVTNGLKDERDSFKEQAGKAADLQKELEGIKGGEDWQKKYTDEHKAFEEYKKQRAADAAAAKVRAAYRSLLLAEGYSEKRVDGMVKVAEARGDLSKLKLGENDTFENADELKAAIAAEWGEFKASVSEQGAKVAKPPQTGKSTLTRAEIMAEKDTTKRQQLISENLELFGKG